MRLHFEKKAVGWLITKVPDAPHGPRCTTANVGAYFFGGRIDKLDLLSKELAADALLHERAFFDALGESVRSSGERSSFSVELPAGASLARFRRMFECAVSGKTRGGTGLALSFGLSAAVALMAVLWSSVRHGGPSRVTASGDLWVAAHPEWSNRSRHLLTAAGARRLPLLLLGRPKGSIRQAQRLLDRHLHGNQLEPLRPLSASAAFAALPDMVRALREAMRQFASRGDMPPLKRTVPILYRLLLGSVHRHWWRRSGAQPSTIVYAHTGNADTSALELEQQAAGSKTVHLLHGISTGHAFTGLSDVAIARCRHDADWHERLGGYGKAVAFEAPCPDIARPSAKWALLTNYAHPTAFADEETAVAFEAKAVQEVAAAAERLGIARDSLLYRPHPALRGLSDVSRRKVKAAADEAGVQRWPADLDLVDLGRFELVVTTPSTVLLDALRAGTVPILVDLAGADAESVYGSYPFRAGSEDELVAAIEQVTASRERAFARAWEAVGPAILPDLSAIEGSC